MRSRRDGLVLTAIALAIGCLLLTGPAEAVEDGLFGVRIGSSYRELNERFGTPHGILFPSGSGLVFQTPMAMAPAQAGLPSFGQQAQAVDIPVWVLPIRAASLQPDQTQWVYDFRERYGIAISILLNGEGADAVATDIIVAGFPKYLQGRAPVKTAKGVVLQSSFEDVLKRYGYPPLIEISPPSGGTTGARQTTGGAMRAGAGGGMGGGGRGGGMRAGGGMRGGGGRGGGMRGGGMRGGGMRGGGRRGGGRGRAEAPALGGGTADTVRVVLTGAPGRGGRGGGMRGGGGRGGGMRGGGGRGGGMRGGGGRGGGMRGGGGGRGAVRTLPPLGAATAGPQEMLTASAVVDHQAISFSRDCTMVYEGIAFTLHDMKVFRIHVSE